MTTHSTNKPSRLIYPLILLLACGSIGLIVFVFAVSPAGAAFFAPTPVPTQANVWAYVELPKPTHTALPEIILIGTPADPPTSTVEEAQAALPTETAIEEAPSATDASDGMTMQIVDDASLPANQGSQTSNDSPPAPYTGSKSILVDISEQHMYVYDGGQLIYSFVASTGINNATRIGHFAVQSKIPNAYGSTWNIWMPNWLGIYYSGNLENGIHALPILPNGATLWEGYLGRPVSYGCVVLGTYESKLLYDWAEIGTPVDIQR